MVDTGCTAATGAWVEAVVRVNTPYAFAVHKNVTDSLQGPGSGRLAVSAPPHSLLLAAALSHGAPCMCAVRVAARRSAAAVCFAAAAPVTLAPSPR